MGELDVVRSHPPFSELGDAELRGLLREADRVSVPDGGVVLEEGGAPADSMFVVIEGRVRLEREGEAMDELGPGESFGFPSLLSREHPAFDVRAEGSTICLRIGREAAERILGSGPGLRFLVVGLRERAVLAERADPGGLQGKVAGSGSLEELAVVASAIPATMVSLRDEGFDAGSIGRATSGVVDALTRRALDLAIAEHGEPVTSWAWLAFGSIGRREPGLAADQDHTVVWEGDGAHEARFAQIAEAVTATLAAAGIPRCPSGVLATSPGWRGPVDGWVDALLEARARPARAAFLVALALDGRKVAGDLRVQDALVRLAEGVRGSDLSWRIARLAVEIRPPIGAFGGLVTEQVEGRGRVLDLKAGGVLPATDLARVAAVRGGAAETSTIGRLRAAAASSVLDEQVARGLEEAFDTFLELRLDRQAACVRAGEPVDSLVEPARLDPVSRSRLRRSLRVVEHAQEALRTQIGAGGRIA